MQKELNCLYIYTLNTVYVFIFFNLSLISPILIHFSLIPPILSLLLLCIYLMPSIVSLSFISKLQEAPRGSSCYALITLLHPVAVSPMFHPVSPSRLAVPLLFHPVLCFPSPVLLFHHPVLPHPNYLSISSNNNNNNNNNNLTHVLLSKLPLKIQIYLRFLCFLSRP